MKVSVDQSLHVHVSINGRVTIGLFCPDSKVHVAHMGPTWVLSAPGRPHVGPMNLAIHPLDWGRSPILPKNTILIGWSLSTLIQVMLVVRNGKNPLPECTWLYISRYLLGLLHRHRYPSTRKGILKNMDSNIGHLIMTKHNISIYHILITYSVSGIAIFIPSAVSRLFCKNKSRYHTCWCSGFLRLSTICAHDVGLPTLVPHVSDFPGRDVRH